jgi:hypothetical protein
MSELTRQTGKVPAIDYSKIPERVNVVIDVQGWVGSILAKTPYDEPNPDFISTMIAFQTITAQSVEEVFQQQGVKKLQEMLPNTPGANTGPIEITDLYVASSDFETGNPSYVIVTAVHMDTGDEFKFTTGATNVQATILGLLLNGMWPIKCQIKRGDTKDKGGRYLLFVLPPD